MLKRFCSKRSGFTLVEIIVAFAVFAIMSTMIAQILQLSVNARRSNSAYEAELAAQEEKLTKIVKDGGDYQNEDMTGSYGLTFIKDTGDELEATLNYAVKSSDKENSAEGINYFLSPVSYDGEYTGTGLGGTGGSGTGGGDAVSADAAMGSTLNVRLTASKGMSYVTVKQVIKDTSYTGAGARYFFEVCGDGSAMLAEDKPYTQYKMYFYMEGKYDAAQSGVVYEDENGNKYTQQVPLAADIIDVGYLATDSLSSATSFSCAKPHDTPVNTVTGNSYSVKWNGGNVVRVGVPFTNEGGGLSYGANNMLTNAGMTASTTTKFYVTFAEDPGELTTASFGSGLNVSTSGSGTKYTLYNIPSSLNPSVNVNAVVYGAHEYVRVPYTGLEDPDIVVE